MLLTGSDLQQMVADTISNIKKISRPILDIFSDIEEIKQLPKKYEKIRMKFGDDPADKISMTLGMKLFDLYGKRIENLNENIILDELENLDTVGKSRLLHYCYDMSTKRFTEI